MVDPLEKFAGETAHCVQVTLPVTHPKKTTRKQIVILFVNSIINGHFERLKRRHHSFYLSEINWILNSKNVFQRSFASLYLL